MNKPHSPFMVIQNFISPKLCGEIVDNVNFIYPDVNAEDKPIKSEKMNDHMEAMVFEKLKPLLKDIEHHFSFNYRETSSMFFEWFPENSKGQDPHCENSSYIRQKWTRTKDRDLTGVIFLSDYRDRPPFDGDFKVCGGKLEFYNFKFGFNPQIGTMIIFPSGPNFINNTSAIDAGELFQVRFHMAGMLPLTYVPENFPGNYNQWFEKFA